MKSKCMKCGRSLGSIFEKNSGICDSCRKNPYGAVGRKLVFKKCSKCNKTLISYEEQKKGICIQCLISGKSKFSF